MKSKLYIAAAVCLLLGFVLGCGEKCGDYYDYIPDPPRSYFLFPEGSWWAFENSATGEIDTMFAGPLTGEVYTSSEGADSPDCRWGFVEGQPFIFDEDKFFHITTRTLNLSVVRLAINMTKHFQVSYTYDYSIQIDEFVGAFDPLYIDEEVISLGENAESALCKRLTNAEYPSDTAWFSRNIGLVRFTYKDTTLSLLNYQIQN